MPQATATQRVRLSTADDWDAFFEVDGPWEKRRGREQTRLFAEAFCRANITLDKGQSLLDASCGLGDALPVFAERFPEARLYGCDYSATAVEKSRERFARCAEFFTAAIEEIEETYDVIYSSNTLEHCLDYRDKARAMLGHCGTLCVLVPYNEKRGGKDLVYDPAEHHVVTFRKDAFDFLLREGLAGEIRWKVFAVPKAWSWSLADWVKQPLLNVPRWLLNRRLSRHKRQILFEIIAAARE